MTIKDIAQKTGVSIRTVSRVLNNSKNVNEETRKKVLDVIEKTGFEVNFLVRSLKSKETKTFIIFISKQHNDYWSQFTNVMIRKIIDISHEAGFRLIVSSSSADDARSNENDGFYLLKNGFADGVFIFDSKALDYRIEYFIKQKIPFVIIGKNNTYEESSYVCLNNIKAGYIGAKYLLDKGYKKLLFMVGDMNFVISQDRLTGFISAVEEYSLNKDQYQVIGGVHNTEIAYQKMKKVLDSTMIPNAVFISGDERALGVYKAINEKGLLIPDNIAVMGIDNIPFSSYYSPSMTSIDQSVEVSCRHAVQILVDNVKNKENNFCSKIIIEP